MSRYRRRNAPVRRVTLQKVHCAALMHLTSVHALDLEQAMMQRTRKRMVMILLIGAGLIVAVGIATVVILLAQVEDWRRDLTTNFASTDPQAADERLRPLSATLDPEALADRVLVAVRPLTRWRLLSRTQNEKVIELHFVRTTPLMRFKDDIHVRIKPEPGGGSILTADSRSRLGNADFGQNPRNLRQLLAAVRSALQ
jgi:uncharacterized protein (DUF1499 family)